MELVGLSAGGSGLNTAGLETCQSAKNMHVDTVYSYGVSYKKPKKPAAGVLVELSAGPLHLEDLGGVNGKLAAFWGSRMGSVSSSVSDLLNVENLENLVAEETSYIDSSEDDKIDETMSRKTHIWTYVLEQSLKVPLFATMNNNDDDPVLLPPKISGSNQLLSSKSRVLESCSFKPVKSFALDVNLSAVLGRTNTSTPSKFPGMIRSTFTSESSLIKAREMAVHEKIVVNSNLKKTNIHSNWEVIVKEIPVDLPKLAMESVFSKFDKIVSIRMQLIGLWQKALIEFESSEVAGLVTSKWSVLVEKDLVCVALAVNDKQMWVSRDCHQALLYTLPVGILAHDLSDLLNKDAKLAAVSTIPIFKGVSLHWASLVLANCTKCEQFSHTTINCPVGGSSGVCGKRVVSDQDWVCLTGIYKKKLAPIACSVSFGSKTWAQVASGISPHVSLFGFSGSDLCYGMVSPSAVSDYLVVSHLSNCLAVLKYSLELLADHVSGILVRLDFFGMVPLVPSFLAPSSVVSAALSSKVNSDIIVDNALNFSDVTPLITIDAVVDFSTSSSKVLTAKVGSLETKLVTLEASIVTCNVRDMSNCAKQADIVCWHKDINNMVSIVTKTKLKGKICPWITDKFDGVHVFTSELDSGHIRSGVAIILDSSLVKHVCKVSEVPGRLLLVRLLFKNKLFVSILGLYAGASLAVCFSQAGEVNSLIAKTVNESFFVVFGGDFNENGSHKCASFKKCFDLGLINFLGGSSFIKSPTWYNSRGITKMIDYVLISSNLVGVVVDHSVDGIDNYFDTNHKAVSVFVELGGLLNVKLNLLRKQANRDCWKYDIKNANEVK
ncbi:hypothetical protein G9A89_007787 [Geosiphon pyriformis]|nr:hypothetical protein G9A89_007787 [Geosiphon pyriformis]